MINSENNLTINFSNQNLGIIKFFFNLLTLLCFFIQIFLGETLEDYYCTIILVALNLIVSQYCFNEKILFLYPISTFIIFCTNIFIGGSALIFKTFFLEPVAMRLHLPLETFVFSFLCIIYLIICHYSYRKINVFSLIKNKFSNILIKLEKKSNFEFNNFIGNFCFLFLILIFLFLERTEQKSLLENIADGLGGFIVMPLIFLLFVSIYNEAKQKNYKYYIYITVYMILVFLYSLASNSRSFFLDKINLVLILLLFFLILGIIKITYRFFFKTLIFFIVAILISPILNNYSESMLSVRILRSENINNPTQNIYNFFENVLDKSQIKFIDNNSSNLFKEDYIPSSIIGRINTIYTTDNLFFASKYLTSSSVQKIQDYEKNQILSIFPEFFIKIFDKDFNKNYYIENTTASLFYKAVESDFVGPKSVGSMFATLQIYHNYYFLIYFYLITIVCFVVADSFWLKTQRFSNLLFPMFYATGGALTGIFAVTSISVLMNLVLRGIPQIIILYALLLWLYNSFLKKNTIKQY
jgi:hypothetical protein